MQAHGLGPLINDGVHGLFKCQSTQDGAQFGVIGDFFHLGELHEAGEILVLDGLADLEIVPEGLEFRVEQGGGGSEVCGGEALPGGTFGPKDEEAGEIGGGPHVKRVQLGGQGADAAAVHLATELLDPGGELALDAGTFTGDGGGAFHAVDIADQAEDGGANPEEEAGGDDAEHEALPPIEAAEQADEAHACEDMDACLTNEVGEQPGPGGKDHEAVGAHFRSEGAKDLSAICKNEPSDGDGSGEAGHAEQLADNATGKGETGEKGDEACPSSCDQGGNRETLESIKNG